MSLFNEIINNEEDWENIHHSIPVFAPLIEHVFKKENLVITKIENFADGSNAVFKIGEYVIKIFNPIEDSAEESLKTEVFATKRANRLSIPVPPFIASGFVDDKYYFSYMITGYVECVEFTDIVKNDADKIEYGRKLRGITDKLNTPCEPFNDTDVFNDAECYHYWDAYPEQFKKERLAYIKSHKYGENVFVHGDLCGDNTLLTSNGEVFIIDFGDAVLAPKVYEHARAALDSELDPMIL